MSRRDKQLEQLAATEAELRLRLEAEVERVADGENTLFFVTREFNPHNLPEHMLPKISENLSGLASEVLRLRELLGEPADTSAALVFRRALQRAADLSDDHRPGPVRMAQELLAALRSQGS